MSPYRRLLTLLPTEAARLLRAANELALARDLHTVTGIVRSAARELTDADGVTFFLRDGGQCHCLDEDAIEPLWKGIRFPIEGSLPGWVMQHGTSAVIPDVYADDRVLVEAYRGTFVKSIAMVPIRSVDPIGAIGAYWSTLHRATDDELTLLTLLADSTALALLNVQLYADTRTAVEHEREARDAAERARFEAEQAAAAKDESLALVAHELRQPLHASMAAVRMMALNKDRPDDAERARAVVERQIQAMSAIVEDLLDAARIVRGDIKLDPQPIDVRAIVQQVGDMVQPLMVERQHDFVVTLIDTPVMVSADPGRVQQVLMNLLTNAIKYTDPGGYIRLSLTITSFDVVISVADTGQGIDPALVPRMFNLFTRGAGTASGFGVGLAVARRLVELHGGTLEARSEGVGRGSEFVVRLPMMDATAVKST